MIGGSNGTNKIKALTINIEEKLYTLNDFIEDLDFNKETLSQIILEQITKDETLKKQDY